MKNVKNTNNTEEFNINNELEQIDYDYEDTSTGKKLIIAMSVVFILAIIASIGVIIDQNENSYNSYNQPSNIVNSQPLGNQNSLTKAEQYINYTAFSKEGLRDQLRYEGFTEGQIDYALSTLAVNYNDQAAKKALQYQNSNLNLSKQGIYDQLRYEKFTPEQAQYGVNSLPE